MPSNVGRVQKITLISTILKKTSGLREHKKFCQKSWICQYPLWSVTVNDPCGPDLSALEHWKENPYS